MESFRCSHCDQPAATCVPRQDVLDAGERAKLVVLCAECNAMWERADDTERERMRHAMRRWWQETQND